MLFVSFMQLRAQSLDSIPFTSFKIMQGTYTLNAATVSEVQLNTGKALPFSQSPNQGKENFSGGIITLITGLHTGSSFESLWIFPNELNMTGKNIKIPLIVTGLYEKNRERVRVRSEDGSKTLETTEHLILHLDSGAWGLFIDQKDTLGAYIVTKRGEDPRGITWKNQLGLDLDWIEWNEYFGDLEWLKDKIKRYGAVETPTDFTIEGVLNGEHFFVVYSGQFFRSILIRDEQLMGVWQDSPYAIMLSKKYKISPYLLLPPDIDPSVYQESLTLLGLAHTIGRNLMGL